MYMLRISAELSATRWSKAVTIQQPTKYRLCALLLLLQTVLFQQNQVHGIRWLGIYRLPRSADHPADTTADRFTSAECHKATNELGLRRRQSRFCSHPQFGFAMLAVLRAAHAVGYHCPKAFSDRRWNCTSIHQLPEVSPELRRGTREQALVHAFASAALLFEIARYCALNKIRYCSCGDENVAHSTADYVTQAEMASQGGFIDPGGALMYESGSADNMNQNMGTVPQAPNSVPMTEGQPTVSRFYWAGCSDNLRIAREYASAFLGFPNVRSGPITSDELDNSADILGMDDMKSERRARSLKNQPNDLHEYDDDDLDHNADVLRVRRSLDYQWQQEYESPVFPYRQQQNFANSQRLLPYFTRQGTHSRNSQQSRRRPRRPVLNRRRGQPQLSRIMDRHNYLAGVVIMEINHKRVCKCHGVSGSCAQRVCFRQLRRIDDEVMQKALKLRYLAAKQITLGGNRQLIAKTFTGSGFVDEIVKPAELVFSEHSPDYCNIEPHRGSVGTQGRTCTLKDTGTVNCLNMCCGRGYVNVTAQEIVQCNCRMADGFKVQCDACRTEVITQQCL